MSKNAAKSEICANIWPTWGSKIEAGAPQVAKHETFSNTPYNIFQHAYGLKAGGFQISNSTNTMLNNELRSVLEIINLFEQVNNIQLNYSFGERRQGDI